MILKSVKDGEKILEKHYKSQLKKMEDLKRKDDISWIKLKFRHSKEVQDIGKKLIENDKLLAKLDDEYKLYGELGCLLHDIGRFYEVGENKLNNIPHGIYGAENILRNVEKETNPFLLYSLKYHDDLIASEKTLEELDKLNLSSNNKKIIIDLLHLVMDSDKLSNFELFQRIDTRYFIREKKDLYFSEKCLENFKKRKLIKKDERETVFDSILSYICWFYDLNLDYSKDIVANNNYAKGFLIMFENEIKDFKYTEENKEKFNALNKNIEEIKEQLKFDKLLF